MNHIFLTVDEAAFFLKIKRSTIYAWIHKRRIPYRKHGSRVVFLQYDLLKWSESNSGYIRDKNLELLFDNPTQT
ncbi:MAG: helix-turn-helix domain-containing protein [Xanthomonadaceae bacterium]|nr:helix-turn-helix domain-containing protein [Xanthomonadaceae bacterium]